MRKQLFASIVIVCVLAAPVAFARSSKQQSTDTLVQRIIEFVVRKAPKKKHSNDQIQLPPPAPPPCTQNCP